MSTYISIFAENPTKGAKDGIAVSENNAQTNPISITLNATDKEEKALRLAIRTKEGYQTQGDTKISLAYFDGKDYLTEGGNISKWKLAIDNDYTDDTVIANADWQDTITITDTIADTNTLFWVKASSDADDEPVVDKTISIVSEGTIEAVE